MNRIALTAVFTLSFMVYLSPELSVSLQTAPLALFAVLSIITVFGSPQRLNLALRSLFAADALVFIFLLSLFAAACSFNSRLDASPAYWLLTTVLLILARMYTSVVPLRDVVAAFCWSGIASVGILLPLSFVSLLESAEKVERFSPFSFHPNLLALLLAGYFCGMVWIFVSGGWFTKILAVILGFACVLIIFFASSRGSIVALIIGAMFASGVTVVRAVRQRRLSVTRIVAVAGTLIFVVVLSVQFLAWSNNVMQYTNQVLQLTDQERGLDSGFTGRWDRWKMVLGVFSDGTWLLGRGLRFTDTMEPLIDDSYLVLLYELGLIPTVLITLRFIMILRAFVTTYFNAVEPGWKRLSFTCSLLLLVFLVNNVVARYLFGVGNPYSLLAFLLYAAPTELLVYSPRRMLNAVPPQVRISAASQC